MISFQEHLRIIPILVFWIVVTLEIIRKRRAKEAVVFDLESKSALLVLMFVFVMMLVFLTYFIIPEFKDPIHSILNWINLFLSVVVLSYYLWKYPKLWKEKDRV
jgi:tellurite resistance protein TehA-like permease